MVAFYFPSSSFLRIRCPQTSGRIAYREIRSWDFNWPPISFCLSFRKSPFLGGRVYGSPAEQKLKADALSTSFAACDSRWYTWIKCSQGAMCDIDSSECKVCNGDQFYFKRWPRSAASSDVVHLRAIVFMSESIWTPTQHLFRYFSSHLMRSMQQRVSSYIQFSISKCVGGVVKNSKITAFVVLLIHVIDTFISCSHSCKNNKRSENEKRFADFGHSMYWIWIF